MPFAVETRVPSVYSFQQLLDGAKSSSTDNGKLAVATGKKLVSELQGACLPKITFGRSVSFHRKRIRSSGDAVVPDIDFPELDT